MEIFSDVEAHKKRAGILCPHCEFICNTFSYGYDVYFCDSAGDSVPVLVFVGPNASTEPDWAAQNDIARIKDRFVLTLNQDFIYSHREYAHPDADYVLRVLYHAVAKGFIDKLFTRSVDKKYDWS